MSIKEMLIIHCMCLVVLFTNAISIESLSSTSMGFQHLKNQVWKRENTRANSPTWLHGVWREGCSCYRVPWEGLSSTSVQPAYPYIADLKQEPQDPFILSTKCKNKQKKIRPRKQFSSVLMIKVIKSHLHFHMHFLPKIKQDSSFKEVFVNKLCCLLHN